MVVLKAVWGNRIVSIHLLNFRTLFQAYVKYIYCSQQLMHIAKT